MRIVECVPNFSEGRDRAIIDQITATIAGTEGCSLLDVDPGKATNRTVVTLVGSPEAVVQGAFNAIAKAAELIDMSKHHGEHPRMGATDVCPFVPVAGVTMGECAELARLLGARVGRELGIPVYLYEHAAASEERRNLANIRAGEYEGLAAKLKDPRWKPDFGPATFNARTGATVIGARQFLLAYNVNLNTRDKKLAHDIALDIREAGRAKRDAQGNIVRNPDGTPVNAPGRLKAAKAVGWYIDEYKRAQISINLVDYSQTSFHDAFDIIREEAGKRGLRVTGSELVGLTPLEPVLMAGRHYLRKQGKSAGAPEREVVDCAVQSLGLRELSAFDPDEKIIEYRLRRGAKGLRHMRVVDFADELSSESPAPGGGSVAALCGSMAASLAAMVANLTVGRKGQESVWAAMSDLAVAAQQHKDWLLQAIDADTDAFNRVLEAKRLPKKTADEIAARDTAVRAANREATLVPLSVLERMQPVLELVRRVVDDGNPNSLSDGGVAALCASTCAEGAYYNVLINLGSLEGDQEWAKHTRQRADGALATTQRQARAIGEKVSATLRAGAPA